MELIEAKTKLDLLRKAQRNSNSDIVLTVKLEERIRELEEYNKEFLNLKQRQLQI